jgi:hypothetical protein
MAVRLEYLGFVDTEQGREYSLVAQEGGGETKKFVLVIANEAFALRTARYQDGPDICYQKLLAVLASPAAPEERIALNGEDLYHYRHAHAPKPPRHRTPRTPATDGGDADRAPDTES